VRKSEPEPRFYSPQEVGNLTGFSAGFIRGEIKAGELEAVYVVPKGRTRGRWLIAVAVARAYARKLGAWRADSLEGR
jgi:hypothetical protein